MIKIRVKTKLTLLSCYLVDEEIIRKLTFLFYFLAGKPESKT